MTIYKHYYTKSIQIDINNTKQKKTSGFILCKYMLNNYLPSTRIRFMLENIW